MRLVQQRLQDTGGQDLIDRLAGNWASLPTAEQRALQFARKLTIAPQQITDRDIAELRRHYQDVEVAEIVYAVCTANFFNRFTETLQLK